MQCALSQRLPRTYGCLGAASYPCVLVFGYVLPPCILIGLAAMMWDAEPLGCWVYGFGIIIGGSSMLLFTIGLGMWRARKWAISGSIVAAFALSAVLPLLQQLVLIMQLPMCGVDCADSSCPSTLREFPYTALTAIAMALNSLPVAAIVFLQLGTSCCVRVGCVGVGAGDGKGREGFCARTRFEQHLPMLPAAGDGPSFPMQQQLPKIANVFLVILGYRRSVQPKTQLLCLYCMSILVLTIYSISVYAAFAWFEQAELESVTKWSGLFASLTVIMLDMEVRHAT